MAEPSVSRPAFREALRFWLQLGCISFGGPAGQIAILHEELVEKRRWVSEARFLHALNFCMLLPGPEAQQLATYLGWLLHGIRGAVVAGGLFVLPSAILLWTLSWLYVTHGELAWVAAVFHGLKPAMLAIVAAALLRIGRKALRNEVLGVFAVAAFVAIFFFRAPFPLILLAAAIAGFAGSRWWPVKFAQPEVDASALPKNVAALPLTPSLSPTGGEGGRRPEEGTGGVSLWRSLRVASVCLLLWWTPVLALVTCLGWNHTLVRESIFFSKAAMVTFGGAYAVLPYVSQQAVEQQHWLTAGQMLDGLALAETTPGPLIMVLQFVGFLGGWNHPGGMPPLLAATLGAAITTWTTFLPSFLWILVGAPHVERLRNRPQLTAALAAVTAAVVGVILNLAVWFGFQVIAPGGRSVDAFAVIVAISAFLGMMRWRWGVIPVVFGSALAGWLHWLMS